MKKIFYFLLLSSIFYLLPSIPAQAQESKLSLSITPPLFQLTIGPGEFWASTLKVINTNPYDLTLYASVMNFRAEGEEGTGKFTPIIKDDPEIAAYSLAHWVDITDEAIFIPREKSVDVPFSVRIPQDAPPGGHYAAILVGTQPRGGSEEGTLVKISSFVSSLLFVRISGDVIEGGRIREFSAGSTFYQKPEVDFTLRFENTGNVHLQPIGEIVIYNMWGKERGKIAINQKSNFGNVLPNSIRKFSFKWQGENNPFEVGKYKAVVTLVYGDEARRTVSRSLDFWVVPLKPTIGILGGIIFFILFMMWVVRRYIKHALALEASRLGYNVQTAYEGHLVKESPRVLVEPLKEGVVDLRDSYEKSRNAKGPRWFLWALLKKYKLFFLFIVVVIIAVIILIFYFGATLIPERSFEVIIQQDSKL